MSYVAWVVALLPGALNIQFAERAFTPSEPLPLGGYTARKGALFEPGGDELVTSAVVLSYGETKVAVVSTELLTIPESLVSSVREKLPPDVHLLLCATHTHCAPDSQMLNDRMTFAIPGIATFKRIWLEKYSKEIADTVASALSSTGADAAQVFAQQAKIGLNRARREGAKPDQTVTFVTPAFMTDGPRRPIWTHYAAHAVIYGPEEKHLRGDWPGGVRKRLGGLVLTGAIGDVSPISYSQDPEASIHHYAEVFANSYATSKPRDVWSQRAVLRWTREPISVGKKSPHSTFAKENGIPDALASMLVDKFAPDRPEISAFRMGKLALIGTPGEPTAELGRQIAAYGKSKGFDPVLVVSHVNGWMGYVLAPKDYDRGGYEARLQFYGRDTGAKLVEAAKRALDALSRR